MAKGGKQPGAGRPKGKQNQRTVILKEMIEGALSAVGGQKYLELQAVENPTAFLTLVGKLLPKDVAVTGDISHVHSVTHASDDELNRIINGG